MTKQYDPPFAPVTKRRSAAKEDDLTRRTDDYPKASQHRVGHTPGLHPEDAPYQSQQIIRPGRGYSKTVPPMRHIVQEEEELDYPDDPPRRRTTLVVRTPVKPTRRLRQTRFHWLVFVGLAMVIMILGWLSFSALSSWWSVQQDDWHYGRVRRFGGS